MSIKGIISSNLFIFGGAVLAMYIYQLLFSGGTIEMRSLTGVLIFSVLCNFSRFIFNIKRELSKRQMLVCIFLHALITLTLVLVFAIFLGWVSGFVQITILSLLVVATYTGMTLLNEKKSKTEADELNKKLEERYK